MSESTVQASAKFVDWMNACGCSVAVTGASGWIGRAVAHLVLQALGPEGVDRLRLYGSRAGAVDVGGRIIPLESLDNARPLGEGEWIVLHLAVAGTDRETDPFVLRAQNEAMLADALGLAGAAGRVRRFVSASSGAVYQAGQGSLEKQAYSDLKRDQEQIVHAWAAKTGVPILIPRIFNVGGPYMNHPKRYALGSFVQQALAGGMIEIGATRPVLRSYVHVLELARVMFDLSIGEAPLTVFDTAGSEIVEMADLAAAVGRALERPNLVVRRPMLSDHDEDRYVGNGEIYRAALWASGVQPTPLDQIILDTAVWLGRAEDTRSGA